MNDPITNYLAEVDKLNKQYKIKPPADIRDYILIPSPKENWLFHGLFHKKRTN